MRMEGNVTIQLVISVFAVTAVAVSIVIYVNNQLSSVRNEAANERQKVRSDLEDQIAELREGQSAFELEVAKHYASDDKLQQMEYKFTAAIEKLINRFDAFATDFHRFAGRVDRRDEERRGE